MLATYRVRSDKNQGPECDLGLPQDDSVLTGEQKPSASQAQQAAVCNSIAETGTKHSSLEYERLNWHITICITSYSDKKN